MADEENYDEIEKKAVAERRARSKTNMRIMNASGTAAIQRAELQELRELQEKWRIKFKMALKVHTPEPPTDELIEKYMSYGTVSDAIDAWLRQREEVLFISSDSSSAKLEAVTRKKSSTTETSSDRQQELKKKKPKSNTDNDVESITSSIASKVFSISDDSKSDSGQASLKVPPPDHDSDDSNMKKMHTVLEGSAPAIRPDLGSLPGTNYFNEEKGKVVKTVQKHPERKFEAHRKLTRVRRVGASGVASAQPLLSSSTMAARRSKDDEAYAQTLQEEECRKASRGGGEARSVERRGSSLSSGRGSLGRRVSQDGRGVSQLPLPAYNDIVIDDDYDSEDSDFVLNDEEEEAYDHILEEEKDNTKQYFFPPNNYVWVRERQGIYTVSTCVEFIRHYIERTDPKNLKLLKEMRWNPKVFMKEQEYIIKVLGEVQTRYLNRKNHQNRVFPPDILEDICLLASLLGDENWLPDYVKKIDKALRKTEEHKPQNAVEPSPTILLGFKLMCPKPNRHLNEGNDGDENGPTEKACKAISIALKGSLMDCGSPFLNPLLSFGSFLGHERMICPCTSPSFRHQGCGWETNREGMINAFIRNLLVQLCLQYNCTMIWLNFNGANGEFAFDLQDHTIVSYKKLFHPSLATYANCKVYGNEKNQKHKVSRRVRGLADYLGTQFGYKFDKSKFLATVSESTVLPMINMQNNTPFLKSSLPSGFVNKNREQKWEKNYTASWNYKEENGNFKGLQKKGDSSHLYDWLCYQIHRSKDFLTATQKDKLYILHKGMENNHKMSKDFIHWYETGIINDPRPKTYYGENDVARREAKLKSIRESKRRNYQKGSKRGACRIEGCNTGARQRNGFCAAHGGRGRYECSVEGCSTGARKNGLCMAHGGQK